ncbi:MAG: zinc ribbon domain-containing protein [Candidatus Aminicenantes bacterium]|nr:zinc ribbon domain-containing protein [Candidatus Aminicenantes bacterium]
MSRTDCPYVDCREAKVTANAAVCPGCKRWLNRCGKCRTPNRSFANYCRSCGKGLPVLNEFWPASRGGAQRLSFSRQAAPVTLPDMKVEEIKVLRFSGRCRSLLAEDGYLFVVSDSGIIQVVDLNRIETEPYTFNVGGKIFAEPAVHAGTLYVGFLEDDTRDRGVVAAYTLGDITGSQPGVKLRWSLDLEGRPVQGLLPFGDRLYLNIGFKNARREIQYIENIGKENPSKPLTVDDGERISTLAANPPTGKVFFLSQKDSRLFVNIFDHSQGPHPEMESSQINGAPADFLEHIPAAVMGAKLFAVFGEQKHLCRIDTHSSSFDIKICAGVRNFALSGMSRQVIVNTTGIFSTIGNLQEDLIRGEGIVSGPVITRENMVVVGMRDGKIRFYRADNLAVQLDYQAFDADRKVLALATFKDMIAAGSQVGEARLLRIGPAGARAG